MKEVRTNQLSRIDIGFKEELQVHFFLLCSTLSQRKMRVVPCGKKQVPLKAIVRTGFRESVSISCDCITKNFKISVYISKHLFHSCLWWMGLADGDWAWFSHLIEAISASYASHPPILGTTGLSQSWSHSNHRSANCREHKPNGKSEVYL